MSEALQLFETAPALTDRQRFVLELVDRAMKDGGADADAIGAALHWRKDKHPVDSRCMYCGVDGKSALQELERKGLVKYRRRTARVDGAWVRVGAPAPMPRGMTDRIPY